MHPSHIISAFHLSSIDLGHELAQPRPQVVGAAIFTGHVEGGKVTFSLDAAVQSARDPAGTLLSWLDRRLEKDQSTLAGFDLQGSHRALEKMPHARWSPTVRVLSGHGRSAINLGASRKGESLTLAECCAALGIPCSKPDPTGDFTAWCTGSPDRIAHGLELDVIAVWRLAMHQIAARSSLGHCVNRVIEGHLATWLRHASFPAAATHLATIAPPKH